MVEPILRKFLPQRARTRALCTYSLVWAANYYLEAHSAKVTVWVNWAKVLHVSGRFAPNSTCEKKVIQNLAQWLLQPQVRPTHTPVSAGEITDTEQHREGSTDTVAERHQYIPPPEGEALVEEHAMTGDPVVDLENLIYLELPEIVTARELNRPWEVQTTLSLISCLRCIINTEKSAGGWWRANEPLFSN